MKCVIGFEVEDHIRAVAVAELESIAELVGVGDGVISCARSDGDVGAGVDHSLAPRGAFEGILIRLMEERLDSVDVEHRTRLNELLFGSALKDDRVGFVAVADVDDVIIALGFAGLNLPVGDFERIVVAEIHHDIVAGDCAEENHLRLVVADNGIVAALAVDGDRAAVV